jgi:hypothetical protein
MLSTLYMVVMGWTIVVQFQLGPRKSLFITASGPTLGPTQPPIQWMLAALSPGIMWPGHESDYSPTVRVEVKKHRKHLSTQITVVWVMTPRSDVVGHPWIFMTVKTSDLGTFRTFSNRNSTYRHRFLYFSSPYFFHLHLSPFPYILYVYRRPLLAWLAWRLLPL